MSGIKSDQVALKEGLMAFCDDFVEFNDYCSFLCDAVSCLFNEAIQAEPDQYTVFGVKRHCSDLKAKSEK